MGHESVPRGGPRAVRQETAGWVPLAYQLRGAGGLLCRPGPSLQNEVPAPLASWVFEELHSRSQNLCQLVPWEKLRLGLKARY